MRFRPEDCRVPPRYEIRLSGPLDEASREAFLGFDVMTDATLTVVMAELDQAALHGLLERIRTLGLELLEVRRVRGAPHRQ
jgi:hypothetical protein